MQFMSKIPCVSLLLHQPCISNHCHGKCWGQSSWIGWEVHCWSFSTVAELQAFLFYCTQTGTAWLHTWGDDQSSLAALYSVLHYTDTYGPTSVPPLCSIYVLFCSLISLHTSPCLFCCGCCWEMGISPPGINYLSLLSHRNGKLQEMIQFN